MDGNFNYRPKPQPRTGTGTLPRVNSGKDRGSRSYSSDEEDFHSDDNLRPYEEVKVAHHDKKLNGLGLTPDEHDANNQIGHHRNSNQCVGNHINHNKSHLYRYNMSGSDGDNESETPVSMSTRHTNRTINHQGSQCSISSNEIDNGHGTRGDQAVSRLSLSDSDDENHHDSDHRCQRGPGPAFPCFPPPPPPPPIEDIPGKTQVLMTRQRSFGPSNRGNYSDAETCLCQGHFVDAHTALLHRGAESDLDNHPRLRHCPYSDCESEFEPHYLEQTSSGNVFIPDGQPRFPRTVPRSGSVPMSRSGEMFNPHCVSPYGSNTVPLQCVNANHHCNNVDSQHAFAHPQFNCPQTVPAAYPPHMTPDYGYYSKFSCAGHQMKKKLRQRCSWKCTALLLVVICVALLACTAYFAAMSVFEEKERIAHNLSACNNSQQLQGLFTPWPNFPSYTYPNGAFNVSHTATQNPKGFFGKTGPTQSPKIAMLSPFHIGDAQERTIPSKSYWPTQFKLNEPKFIKLNFTISSNAILGVFGRRNVPPTVAQFDFFEVFDGKRISSNRNKRSSRYRRGHFGKDTALIQHLDAGIWYMTLYNDKEEPQFVAFRTEIYDTLGTDCPSDCHGHGECYKGQCRCFPGYTGWDCSQNQCTVLCNGNGQYDGGVCRCHAGWKGRECEIPEHECEVPNCNGNGRCINGQCICLPGFKGPHCGLVDCLLPNCSGNGVCQLGTCVCYKGFKGVDCSLPDKLNISQVCARNCSGHGIYDIEAGQCICERFFAGLDCEREICRLECAHGHCKNQQCVCDDGWGGALCDQVSCDARCVKEKGICDNGTCICKKGWNGKHCTIDGCPNSCGLNGDCRHFPTGWMCGCHDGWKGKACAHPMEMNCKDGKDNDRDGLTDCLDPDCCLPNRGCTDHSVCQTSPDPRDILLRKQPPSTTASFYEKTRFLIEDNSVQIDTSRNAFNESQVSLIRGKVETKDGTPLLGVRVSITRQPLYGFTYTRNYGMFDILVNGGGSVTLEFTKSPFQTSSVSVMVPWNQIITMDPVVMVQQGDAIYRPDPAQCGVFHDHFSLKPVVLPTWQHTQLGACPEKSTVIPESQVLQESLVIPATNVHLVYHSSETPGYKSVILIQMTPDYIPPNLALVHLKVSVQGIEVEKMFEADPGLKYTFSWDRKNAYSQKVYGIVPATVHVGYQYAGCSYVFWEVRSTTMSGFDLTSSEIGGWNLDIHHTYNFQEGILHKGDGTNIYLKEKPQELISILGTGQRRNLDCAGCNGRALDNRLLAPVALASGRDGSLYVWDRNFIRKLSPGRDDIASILQTSTTSTSHKTYMTVSPVDGRLYISDYMNHRIIRVATMGPVRDLSNNYEVVAGVQGEECTPGGADQCGDGKRAVNARLVHPKGIAISKDGIVYIADNLNIRMITPDGIIQTVIGTQGQPRPWEPMSCDDSQPANKIRLQWPTDLAINPLDDTLHILDKNIILKLTKDGNLVTVAGRPINCPRRKSHFLPSGVLSDEDQASGIAVDVKLINPQSIAFGPQGEIYIVESDTHSINRVRVVTTDGRIHHFAGTKSKCDCQQTNCKCFNAKETLAAMALFKELTSVTVTPDGITHIADAGNLRVFSIMSKLPEQNYLGQYEVYSPETQEMYIFNRFGQHQNTINIMTNQFMYNFTYNVNSFYGKLVSVVDDAGNRIQIGRDHELQVKVLVSIDGSKCQLSMDNMRRLHRFLTPDNSTTTYAYMESSGLLKSKFLSDGRSYTYEYDDMGRLLEVRQPTGEITTITTDVNTTGSIVHFNTDNSDAVAMATYGSVQSVMHGSAETRVTYLPDGAVVVVFPTNLSISIESGGHPILANQHRMHFKRKLIGPKKQIHKLEWRFYLRRKGRSRQRKVVQRIGHRMRVGAHFSRHVGMHDQHEDPGYKGKALLINGVNLLTIEYNRETHTESIMDKDFHEIINITYDNSGLPTHFHPSNHYHGLDLTYSQSGQITQWQYGEMKEKRFYGENGLLREITTSSGSQYRFQYRYGKMPTDILLPSGLQYYLEYDHQGNLIMVRTPGLGKHYFYRAMSISLQRYLYQIPEMAAPYTEEYDGNGKLLQIVYPSEQRRVVYRYNQYSQMKKQLYDETEISFEYDEQISKLSSSEVVDGAYNCYQVYKYRGAVTSEYQVNYSKDSRLKSVTFNYEYDNNFRLIQIQGKFQGNFTTSYNIDYDRDTGKLKKLKSLYFIWPVPGRQQISDNNVRMIKLFDSYGRIQSTTFTFGDEEQFSVQIGYDLMNRIHHWNCMIGGNTRNLQYVYDKNGNVIDIFYNGKPTWRYGYDNNGNINKITEHDQTRNLEFDVGDRLKRSGQMVYKFDQDGFMIQRHDQHIAHNSKGQVTSISKAGEFRYFYYYDSEDRLTVIEENGGSVMQLYYADIINPSRITHTYNQTTNDITQYFYDVDGKLLAMERRGILYYVAIDPIGTPIAVFSTDGTVVKELTFNPLGFMENDSNPSFEFIFGFQGGIYSTVTELLYLHKRIYDTTSGHWISPNYGSILKNLKKIPDSPTITNNYQYRELINTHSRGKQFPYLTVTDWLSMLGFDIRSLAPDVSYTGEIRPKNQDAGKELLPMSSAFECTFLRDMESLITMTTVPKSHVSPLQKQKNLQSTSIPFILGDGITLSQKDGRVVIGIIPSTPDWARQLASNLLNGSHFTDLKYNINGKDVHFFVKEDATKAEEDLRMLGIHSNIAFFENGINVTVNRIKRREGYRLHSYEQVDVRIHGMHSVLNVRYGTTLEHERLRVLRHAKERAIERAWGREKWIILNSLPTQYRWSEQERQQILTVGYADGYEGHYIRSPELYPELSDDCNNIRFIKGSR